MSQNIQQKIDEIICDARIKKASDIHLSEGMPIWYRIHGKLIRGEESFSDEEMEALLIGMLSEQEREQFEAGKDVDFAITTTDGKRQRVNVFHQQKKIAATIRLLNSKIPTLEELKIPTFLYDLAKEPRGLILVTGPTGSGKSTTLAAMIEHINCNSDRHIITIEDPIEYEYQSKKSLVHQREVGSDVGDFAMALRSALREDPDVILVGEMRDYETIQAALLAAETGHLVLSTLHTIGAASTVERIIDACPTNGQNQVRTQLAGTLKGVISQCLIPCEGGIGRIAATEIMTGTSAVLNLIREGKVHQIGSHMQMGSSTQMHTLNMDLARLVKQGYISKEQAFSYTNDRVEIESYF